MIVLCSQCGVKFNKSPSQLVGVKAVFCSKVCQNSSQKRRIGLVCPICFKPFDIRPCEVKRYHTCSMSCARQYRQGKNNPNWRGGVAKSCRPEMSTAQYKNWRKAVFERDDYTCIDCGKHGGSLEADHSKTWAEYPNLRYEISNGITRCKTCYTQRHTKHDGKWVGADFDGTLADFECDWPKDYRSVGKPIPRMVERVKRWILEGEDVRIFTARMDCFHPIAGQLTEEEVKTPLEAWCLQHLGKVLPITNEKDYWCRKIYDDRVIHVEQDTGVILGEEEPWRK